VYVQFETILLWNGASAVVEKSGQAKIRKPA
jgi:hypothetical protein